MYTTISRLYISNRKWYEMKYGLMKVTRKSRLFWRKQTLSIRYYMCATATQQRLIQVVQGVFVPPVALAVRGGRAHMYTCWRLAPGERGSRGASREDPTGCTPLGMGTTRTWWQKGLAGGGLRAGRHAMRDGGGKQPLPMTARHATS